MITSRLDSTDRTALVSGNVYAWEERGSRSEPGVGIERFTEGKRWTPSRLREVRILCAICTGFSNCSQDFLYYYEKYLHLSENDQKLLYVIYVTRVALLRVYHKVDTVHRPILGIHTSNKPTPLGSQPPKETASGTLVRDLHLARFAC